jgi:hypothetical protein
VEEPSDCTPTPEPDPEGPLTIAISPDGADLYVASDFEISEFSRTLPGGALTFVGCVGEREKLCTTTKPPEAIEFPLSLALSPNGASLYSGDELAEVVNEFGRATLPACANVQVATAYQTPTTVTLPCSDVDGKAVSISVASGPTHGTLGPVGGTGQVTYTPAPGYSGPDSFTFTATNADGTSAAATASLSVGAPPASISSGPARVTRPPGIASTPQQIEELLRGCTSARLVLNDVYVKGNRVAISGSAAKSLVGKKVKILFGVKQKQVASAVVKADGEYATSAPLPPVAAREANSTRYQAVIGKERSLRLKLARRLELEPPIARGTTVTLSGRVQPPLT